MTPWKCEVREVAPGVWKTIFSVGCQSFRLAESDDPEEGKTHCEFIRDQFIQALKNAGMP